MTRRNFIAAAVLAATASLLSAPSMAQYSNSPGMQASPTGTVVLELANFHCGRCRAMNEHFDRFRAAARDNGLDFRFAPVGWQGQSMWPDRVYYATRDLYPAAEGIVRNAMFEGIQREGMQFEELTQVVAYLERRQAQEEGAKLDPNFNLASIAERAMDETTLLAEAKAYRLIQMSGADAVPAFLWIRDGEVIHSITTKVASDAGALSQAVMRALTNGELR